MKSPPKSIQNYHLIVIITIYYCKQCFEYNKSKTTKRKLSISGNDREQRRHSETHSFLLISALSKKRERKKTADCCVYTSSFVKLKLAPHTKSVLIVKRVSTIQSETVCVPAWVGQNSQEYKHFLSNFVESGSEGAVTKNVLE